VEVKNMESTSNNTPTTTQPNSSEDHRLATAEEAKQAEYRRAYQQQLRRMHCPTCGEGEPVF